MTLQYAIPRCPICGADIAGEVDLVPGRSEVERNADGTYQYTGETDMFWDGQENEIEVARGFQAPPKVFGLHRWPKRGSAVLVECHEVHQWVTTVIRRAN